MRRFGDFWRGRDGEDGQAIILIAITLLGMLMIVGVAIDAGQVYSARRAMQEAADAAAYAAAVTMYQGGSQGQAFQAAKDDAKSNGFEHNVNNTTVTVNQPTTSPYDNASYVEVTIVQNVRTSLVPAEAVFTSVTVHSIGGARSLNNYYAMMALDSGNTGDAFIVGSNAHVTLAGGGILVNSTATGGSPAATNATPVGQWSISCTGSCSIDVAGGFSGTWPAASGNYLGIRSGQLQQADPFAGYPKPSTTGMLTDRAGFGASNKTLGQGIYTSSISGKKFCHGIYILKGGGLGGDLDVDTTDTDPVTNDACDGHVFIFNTTTTYPLSGGTCNGLQVNGNHDITLYAMTSGTYQGMLFYQDAACTAELSFGGSSFDMGTTGTIYLPNAKFHLQTTGSGSIGGGQIVAKTIDLGNGTVNVTFNSGTSAQPLLPRLAK